MELMVSQQRLDEGFKNETGVYARATMPDGRWVSADICTLTKESLLEWLASREPNSVKVLVCTLLGY